MEVVQDRGAAEINAEYEMIQDGATSSSLNEDAQAMDYSALDSHPEGIEDAGEEDVYEVTMEEYGHDGEMMEAEGEMVEPAGLPDLDKEEEEMMKDEIEIEDGQDYGGETETVLAEPGGEEEVEEREAHASAAEDVGEGAAPVQLDPEETQEGGQASTEIAGVAPSKSEVAEEAIEIVEAGEPKDATVLVVVEESAHEAIPAEEASHQGEDLEAGAEETTAEGADDVNDDLEEGEEIHAPPAVRVTFNGQDFVLFPHSEPSTYISAQQEDPIAAPRLKADPSLFYDSMDSLIDALRVKDSLGDFLEEGTELQVNFVDLQLVLREDDIYAKEVSLNDLHRLHLGLGLNSSLHLTISETARFITRYNELAAHAANVFEQAAEQSGEIGEVHYQEDEEAGEEQGKEEGYDEEVIGQSGEGEEEQPEGEYHRVDEASGAEEKGTVTAIPETNDGEDSEVAKDAGIDYHGGETLALNKEEVASLEASVPHQNYEEDGGEAEAELEAEGEDIVDYDEVYQSDGDEGVNGNAEYEPEGHEAEEEETGDNQDETLFYEAEEEDDGNPLRLKRSLEEDDDDEATAEINEGESKRVKVNIEEERSE